MLNEGLEWLVADCKYHVKNGIFFSSGLEEITLPSTLRDASGCVFDDCPLRVVWVRSGCTADIRRCVDSSVQIFPARTPTVRDGCAQGLRGPRDVVIPEGIVKIEARWFSESNI